MRDLPPRVRRFVHDFGCADERYSIAGWAAAGRGVATIFVRDASVTDEGATMTDLPLWIEFATCAPLPHKIRGLDAFARGMRQDVKCSRCNGRGAVGDAKCPMCRGRRYLTGPAIAVFGAPFDSRLVSMLAELVGRRATWRVYRGHKAREEPAFMVMGGARLRVVLAAMTPDTVTVGTWPEPWRTSAAPTSRPAEDSGKPR